MLASSGGKRQHLSNNKEGSVLPHGTAHQGMARAWAKVADRFAGFRGKHINSVIRALKQLLQRLELGTAAAFFFFPSSSSSSVAAASLFLLYCGLNVLRLLQNSCQKNIKQ